ncbi:MAG: hypothetical protein SGPRY_000652, partial [Prymnesium sp.]
SVKPSQEIFRVNSQAVKSNKVHTRAKSAPVSGLRCARSQLLFYTELIDNFDEASAGTEDRETVVVKDNGPGQSEAGLNNMLKLAYHEAKAEGPSAIGRYGIGFKASVFGVSTHVELEARPPNCKSVWMEKFAFNPEAEEPFNSEANHRVARPDEPKSFMSIRLLDVDVELFDRYIIDNRLLHPHDDGNLEFIRELAHIYFLHLVRPPLQSTSDLAQRDICNWKRRVLELSDAGMSPGLAQIEMKVTIELRLPREYQNRVTGLDKDDLASQLKRQLESEKVIHELHNQELLQETLAYKVLNPALGAGGQPAERLVLNFILEKLPLKEERQDVRTSETTKGATITLVLFYHPCQQSGESIGAKGEVQPGLLVPKRSVEPFVCALDTDKATKKRIKEKEDEFQKWLERCGRLDVEFSIDMNSATHRCSESVEYSLGSPTYPRPFEINLPQRFEAKRLIFPQGKLETDDLIVITEKEARARKKVPSIGQIENIYKDWESEEVFCVILELTWRPEKRRIINFKDLFGVSHSFTRTEDLVPVKVEKTSPPKEYTDLHKSYQRKRPSKLKFVAKGRCTLNANSDWSPQNGMQLSATESIKQIALGAFTQLIAGLPSQSGDLADDPHLFVELYADFRRSAEYVWEPLPLDNWKTYYMKKEDPHYYFKVTDDCSFRKIGEYRLRAEGSDHTEHKVSSEELKFRVVPGEPHALVASWVVKPEGPIALGAKLPAISIVAKDSVGSDIYFVSTPDIICSAALRMGEVSGPCPEQKQFRVLKKPKVARSTDISSCALECSHLVIHLANECHLQSICRIALRLQIKVVGKNAEGPSAFLELDVDMGKPHSLALANLQELRKYFASNQIDPFVNKGLGKPIQVAAITSVAVGETEYEQYVHLLNENGALCVFRKETREGVARPRIKLKARLPLMSPWCGICLLCSAILGDLPAYLAFHRVTAPHYCENAKLNTTHSRELTKEISALGTCYFQEEEITLFGSARANEVSYEVGMSVVDYSRESEMVNALGKSLSLSLPPFNTVVRRVELWMQDDEELRREPSLKATQGQTHKLSFRSVSADGTPQEMSGQIKVEYMIEHDDEKTHKTPEICGPREIVMEKGVAELIVSVPDKKNDVPFVLEIQLSPTMVAPPHATLGVKMNCLLPAVSPDSIRLVSDPSSLRVVDGEKLSLQVEVTDRNLNRCSRTHYGWPLHVELSLDRGGASACSLVAVHDGRAAVSDFQITLSEKSREAQEVHLTAKLFAKPSSRRADFRALPPSLPLTICVEPSRVCSDLQLSLENDGNQPPQLKMLRHKVARTSGEGTRFELRGFAGSEVHGIRVCASTWAGLPLEAHESRANEALPLQHARADGCVECCLQVNLAWELDNQPVESVGEAQSLTLPGLRLPTQVRDLTVYAHESISSRFARLDVKILPDSRERASLRWRFAQQEDVCLPLDKPWTSKLKVLLEDQYHNRLPLSEAWGEMLEVRSDSKMHTVRVRSDEVVSNGGFVSAQSVQIRVISSADDGPQPSTSILVQL